MEDKNVIPTTPPESTSSKNRGDDANVNKNPLLEPPLLEALSAIISYGAACMQMYAQPAVAHPQIIDNLKKIMTQAERAVKIVTECRENANQPPR